MPSPLDYNNSEEFRRRLLTKNLAPYSKAPNRPQPPYTTEYNFTVLPVVDSNDVLIDTPVFADNLYRLNQFGSEGGYQQVPDPNALLNTKSNEGEYGPLQQDAKIVGQSVYEVQRMKSINPYGDGTLQISDAGVGIESLERPELSTNVYNNQPYPTTFVPSTYAPVSILLQQDPGGSNGLLSQDSYLASLGAKSLKQEFLDRIAAQIRKDTIGRANLFTANDGVDLLNIAAGITPLIEPNYQITMPQTPILAATDFALRLAGSILPISTIPGSYFDPSINNRQLSTIEQLQVAFAGTRNIFGNFFTRLLGGTQTGSVLFLQNTGAGTRSRLFFNLDYNKFKPNYNRTAFNRLGGALVATTTQDSNFYIGSTTSDPSQILSPAGEIPVDQYGREQQAQVYGPSEIAKLYEGPDKSTKLGANGPAYIDGGGIEGGFTWVSPKYKDNAGKRVGIGGEVTSQDQDFKPSSYNTTESTNLEFKEGSILYDTQKLIDSQPQGGRRLQHAGNAIDQVSKVFNDGYVEMTKGSRVYKYIGAIGQEVGTEYCRVFAKDTPYLQYNDLQKTDGITTENRRFPMSVLDKTYNLNIAPNKREGGMDSTNLTLNTATNTSGAKKYMFSLENLAWRTSSTPGFSTSELPVCEKGPNGGRIMWFPPYDLKFNETVTANWKPQDFLGRPEPIYTYTNTSRGGTLSWKIVVDHPSVLNVIVNKVLGNESNKVRINGIIDSFFAGCRKYDLYELAKKYETIKPSDLYELQEIVTSKEASREALSVLINDVATGNNDTKNSGGNPGGQPVADPNTTTPQPNIKKFQNFALYFPNDQPKPPDSSVIGYPSYYSIYDAQTQYKNGAELENFFNTVVTANYTSIQQELLIELGNFLETNKAASVTIELVASTSAAGTNSYNLSLANRRLEAVDQFIFSNDKIRAAIDRVKIIKKPLGEDASVQSFDGNANKFVLKTLDKKCTEIGDQEVFTTNAMACRRVTITNINVTNPPPPAPPNTPATVQNPSTGNGGGLNGQTTSPSQLAPLQPQKTLSNPNNVERKYVQRDNITKRVIRAMISECDYFETIKEETPMVYDNLRDQLKFFQPAFHSMTPEGLNSRLTFLQQCMRPGDTIPTVKEFDGTTQLQYNNATNTAFGTPPVLILRVGDFYNTKIIPNNLTLNFEGLDINPEGIGVQPMIANVQLSFNFVGGSGLAEAVDKLQNALSFNYYANTEIWDDRADATDQYIKVLDKQFLQDVGIPPPPLQNQVQNNYTFSNTDTIGKRTSTVITTTTESGDISYREFMDSFVAGTQTYFQSVLNKNREVLRQYNNAMMQIWSLQTLYTRGTFVLNDVNQNDVSLFGKPDSIEKMIQPIFDEYVASINTSNVTLQDPYIEFISSESKQYTRSTLNAIKRNYTKFINDKKGTFLGPLFSIIQDMTLTQQSYIQFIARANTTPAGANPSTGMDGYQEQNGNVRIFETAGTPNVTAGSTATNTLDEMNTDILKIRQDLIDFHQKTISRKSFDVGGKNYKGWLIYGETPAGAQVQTPTAREVLDVVFFPFSDNVNFVEVQQFRRMYLLCSQDLKDENYQNFKDAIIGSIKNNPDLTTGGADYRQIEIEFDNYWKVNTKPIFDKETEIANTFLTTIETQPTEFKNYLNYTPFPSKERVLTYQLNTTPLTYQKTLIKSLGATLNINSDKLTWNSQKDVSAYISKAKLN